MSRNSPKAASRYKQVRLTFTEQAGGHLSVSLYVKPLNVAWSEHQCVSRWTSQTTEPIETLEDAIGVLIGLLSEHTLPGIG